MSFDTIVSIWHSSIPVEISFPAQSRGMRRYLLDRASIHYTIGNSCDKIDKLMEDPQFRTVDLCLAIVTAHDQ
ncbi:hypothetical protein BDV36DRAFT_244362 [Aspergillus pseudocaelatus]|uniref:Uncharacterized protein n=1 Tax=Aspergillus pseudocaelatus TaxID=1825620 RepID=A0ABQ6X0U0_9EURO|nr:hypothetical protein BDV36DRAFT_244362 [Aspergillus pseudocaelatus]